MNSYPAELVLQLVPIMFVAGLDEPRPPVLDGQTENSAGPTTPRKPTSDPFYLLTMRLREALVSQRKPTIWSPETVRKSKTFQVLLVDKVRNLPILVYYN